MKLSTTTRIATLFWVCFGALALSQETETAKDADIRDTRDLQQWKLGNNIFQQQVGRPGNGNNGNRNGFGNGRANGNGNGNGNRGPPDFVLDRFIQRQNLKAGADLRLQEINTDDSPVATVDVGGTVISVDEKDLTPVMVFAKGARVFVDGQEMVGAPQVFVSNQDDSITVTRVHRQFSSASKRQKNTSNNGSRRGQNVDVVPVEETGFFATLDETDLDDEQLKEFVLGDLEIPAQRRHRNRHLRSFTHSLDEAFKAKLQDQQPRTGTRDHRSLQAAVFDVVEMDIVIDSYLCAILGGQANAIARVLAVINDASSKYEGFNVKLKIKNLFTYCTASTDPMRPLFNTVGTAGLVCASTGSSLIELFGDYVYANQGAFTGDLAHLFHGFDITSGSQPSVIGCAYVGALCSSYGYKTGVNQLAWQGPSTPLALQGKLVAHEAGHNLGADHISNTNYIMNPYICSNCNVFSPTSIAAFQSEIAGNSGCISQEGPPTNPPTKSPTKSPTKAPTTKSPTPIPTKAPTPGPTKAPTTKSPTKAPTATPTRLPTATPTGSPVAACVDDPEWSIPTYTGGSVGCAYFTVNWPAWYCPEYAVVAENCKATCAYWVPGLCS